MEDLKMGMILNCLNTCSVPNCQSLSVFMVCFPAAIVLKKKTTKSAMLFSSLVDMASLYLPTVSVNNGSQRSALCQTLQTLLSEALWASGSSLDAERYCSVQTGFKALLWDPWTRGVASFLK